MKLFEPFGAVVSIRIRKNNGARFFRTKGVTASSTLIAFVDYATQAEANASLTLNGSDFGDNQIRVDLQSKAKSSANGEPNAYDGKRTVFVGNLKYCKFNTFIMFGFLINLFFFCLLESAVTEQMLTDTFKCCGDLDYVRALQCDKGCKGIAYVCFKDNASVTMALELNNSVLEGREIRVERYTAGKQGAGAKREKTASPAAGGAKKRLEQKAAKKGDFAGVKTDKKKGKGKPAKGGLSGPKLLAKKIAPRPSKITA